MRDNVITIALLTLLVAAGLEGLHDLKQEPAMTPVEIHIRVGNDCYKRQGTFPGMPAVGTLFYLHQTGITELDSRESRVAEVAWSLDEPERLQVRMDPIGIQFTNWDNADRLHKAMKEHGWKLYTPTKATKSPGVLVGAGKDRET